jgi:hypothetical protein
MNAADPRYVERRYRTPRNPGALSVLSGFLANNPKYRDKSSIKNIIRNVDSYSLHKDVRTNFQRRVVQCGANIDETWAAD